MRLNFLIIIMAVAGIISGCSSSPKKAKISSDLGPKEIVEQISELQSDAEDQHADLFYPKDFKSAGEYLDKVKDEANNNNVDLNDLRKNASYAKALFKGVISKSKKLDSSLDPIIDAREMALKSGIKKYGELKEELADLDDELRDKSDDFKKKLDPKKFADFQKRYLMLETAGIQKRKLSKSRTLIEAAEDNGAKSKASASYDEALKSLKLAENMIASSPSDSERFKDSVDKARKDAIFLSDVMDAMKNSDSKLSEKTARQLIKSKYKLKKQDERIAELEGHLDEKNKQYRKANEKLETKSKNFKYELITSEVRQKVDDGDAEVFERDDILIIRIKKPLFNKGAKNLSSKSMNLIETISSVLKKASPDEVTIEGHSDSKGDQVFNKALSSGKAEVVAKYFEDKKVSDKIETVGKGSDEPISSESTKKGRAKNQRIDILVKIN